MAKKAVIRRVDRHLARRLREARQETGMSTRKAAERLPKRASVSHATLASYEKGTTKPPVAILGALADIYQRPLNWFLDSRESLTGFRYRNLKPRTPISDQRLYEAQAHKWVEAYVKLERHLKVSHRRGRKSIDIQQQMSPGRMSAAVRAFLDLDDDQPVVSTVAVLESFAAYAIELQASFGIDGAAARRGEDFVVVFNPIVDNDRLRMNAAHELAYVLYKDNDQLLGCTASEAERSAYIFSSSLLLPDSQLELAFEGKSFLQLIKFKEKFGISLAAMIYRAEKARIINSTTSRHLWSEISKRGWRKHEPGSAWRDRAISFEVMLESAIQTKKLTWKDAERITGICEQELRQRIVEATDRRQPQDTEDRDLHPTTLCFPFTSEVSDSIE